jgi:hypothetical protein
VTCASVVAAQAGVADAVVQAVQGVLQDILRRIVASHPTLMHAALVTPLAVCRLRYACVQHCVCCY